MSLKPYCQVRPSAFFVNPNEQPPRLRKKPVLPTEPAYAYFTKGSEGIPADEEHFAPDYNDRMSCDSSLMVIELEMNMRRRSEWG